MQARKRTKWKPWHTAAVVLMLMALVACLVWQPAQRLYYEWRYPLGYTAEVEQWAGAFGVDPYLVYAVIHTESGFDPAAESSAGARGLMQMTEETFDWVKTKIAPAETLTFNDLYEPGTSVRFGVYFFAFCMERYGYDVSTAAAAYHSGMGTVDRLLAEPGYSTNGVWLREFPYAQMNNYVRKVNSSYLKYRELYAQIEGVA